MVCTLYGTVTRIIELRRIQWTEHAARKEDKKNTQECLKERRLLVIKSLIYPI
jgi:hypothetical protein